MALYCKYWGDWEHNFGTWGVEYFAETEAQCKAAARKDGWIIHRDRTATCPGCARIAKVTVEIEKIIQQADYFGCDGKTEGVS